MHGWEEVLNDCVTWKQYHTVIILHVIYGDYNKPWSLLNYWCDMACLNFAKLFPFVGSRQCYDSFKHTGTLIYCIWNCLRSSQHSIMHLGVGQRAYWKCIAIINNNYVFPRPYTSRNLHLCMASFFSTKFWSCMFHNIAMKL